MSDLAFKKHKIQALHPVQQVVVIAGAIELAGQYNKDEEIVTID